MQDGQKQDLEGLTYTFDLGGMGGLRVIKINRFDATIDGEPATRQEAYELIANGAREGVPCTVEA